MIRIEILTQQLGLSNSANKIFRLVTNVYKVSCLTSFTKKELREFCNLYEVEFGLWELMQKNVIKPVYNQGFMFTPWFVKFVGKQKKKIARGE